MVGQVRWVFSPQSKAPTRSSFFFLPHRRVDNHDIHEYYMGVSKNRGIPKWMVYNGNPIKMDDLGGKPTIFGNIHIYIYIYICIYIVYILRLQFSISLSESWVLIFSFHSWNDSRQPSGYLIWLEKMDNMCMW